MTELEEMVAQLEQEVSFIVVVLTNVLKSSQWQSYKLLYAEILFELTFHGYAICDHFNLITTKGKKTIGLNFDTLSGNLLEISMCHGFRVFLFNPCEGSGLCEMEYALRKFVLRKEI